jgi:hypothetical protein
MNKKVSYKIHRVAIFNLENRGPFYIHFPLFKRRREKVSSMTDRSNARAALSAGTGISIILAFVILLGLGIAVIFGGQNTTSQTTTTTDSTGLSTQNFNGVVTGYVTVGPSQPVCRQNQSCTVDLSDYSLEFTTLCQAGSKTCETLNYSAVLSPSGHYAALLPAGNYSIAGLSPTCKWLGCSSTFPKMVTVEGGNQLVLNLNIDTGIR